MRTCGWCLELSVFFLVSFVFYLVLPFSFQPFLMSASALNERSMSNPLCYSSLGSVVTSDYVTPLTKLGDSWWRKAHKRQPVEDWRCCKQAVLQPGMGDNPAKFEKTWKAWERQVDVYENLAASKLDDDADICVVCREAPSKLRDNLLVNSQQFESN